MTIPRSGSHSSVLPDSQNVRPPQQCLEPFLLGNKKSIILASLIHHVFLLTSGDDPFLSIKSSFRTFFLGINILRHFLKIRAILANTCLLVQFHDFSKIAKNMVSVVMRRLVLSLPKMVTVCGEF